MTFTEEQREEVARILEMVAKDGLPGPRDLDVALDAIEAGLSTGDASDDDDGRGLIERGAKFWLVWNKDGRNPLHGHANEGKARREARRLARKHPGATFIVLGAISKHKMEPADTEPASVEMEDA